MLFLNFIILKTSSLQMHAENSCESFKKKKKEKKKSKEMILKTQFKIEFLLLGTGSSNVLGIMSKVVNDCLQDI